MNANKSANIWPFNRPTSKRGRVEYMRAGEQLPPEAMRELEEFLQHLRDYYGVPDGQPVFPDEPKAPRTERTENNQKRATGLNPDDHPWRNTL
jgi:hypothetical protein